MGRLRQTMSLSSDTSAGDANVPGQEEEQPEYILKEMYLPPASFDAQSSDQQDLVDLVFVHGLGGNLRTTWKVDGTTEPWFTKPEFLGRLQNSVRALSFGYNANRFGDVANTRIIHHANDLLRNLVLKRLDNPNRPIIFIAHSLGGLVVKRAILLCATNNDWSAIKNSTKSIIFMGTPHMGSEKAEDLVVVQKLASLMKFQSAIATNLTKELKTFSTAVQDINMEFTIDVHRSIELLCCYESHPQRLPSGSREIIVPQWSAVLQGVDNIDLNCHHSGLPKFRSPDEPRFELFWGEVQRLVRKATAPTQKLIKAPTWTDEEAVEPTPPRARQVVPSRRRQEVAQKGIKPSRASIIRSSADQIVKEVQSRIAVETPSQQESSVSPLNSRDIAENIDPREFIEYARQLRTVTPENRGLDREPPHWQTCQWILNNRQFINWKESDEGSLLFITGSPGCGKSNLAKYIQGVMEEPATEDAEESLVVSFYCDSLESSRASPPILDLVVRALLSKPRAMSRPVRQKLRSLLENFIPDRQKTHAVLENEFDKRFNHLMEIVQTLVTDQNGTPACLIIDGLDQCEDNFILRFLRGLDSIFRREGSRPNLKVVITSRMADSIRGFALANSHIEVTPAIVEADIQRVVDEEVDRIIMSRQIATIGVTSVSAVIVERSNGSFLFAASVLKELWLIKDTGANSVFTLVTSCPSTMEAIYQQDMDRLESERPDLFKLVRILCIAKRAIRVPEAREILRMQNPEITENYDLIGDLTRTCQRLVKFGSEDTLELLHQTLYDFIINTYDVSLIHASFAEICLQYLSSQNWDKILQISARYHSARNRRYQIDRRYPLMDYACPWMGYHWRHAGAAAVPKAWELWDFICSEDGRKWQRYSLPKRTPQGATSSRRSRSSSMSSDASSVIYIRDSRTRSRSGDESSLSESSSDSDSVMITRPRRVLSRSLSRRSDSEPDSEPGSDSNSESGSVSDSDDEVRSDRSGTPTTSRPSDSVVIVEETPKPPLVILAQWDVDCIIRELFFDALESTPRQLFHKFLSTVPYLAPRSTGHSLSDFKAMVNEVWDGTTAVHYAAAQTGKALEVMLPYVNDINLPDDDGATPLILAAASGEIKGVSLLLEAGADIDHTDCWRQTALYSALHANSAEVVEILLKYGADPNIPAESGHSPLEVTIGKNHAEYAKILLEYSPDVLAPMTTGQPPAFLAHRLGSFEVLELLLPHIDVDQIWDGERVIHNSCWRGLESVVKKLIKLGANLDDPPLNTPKATPVALAAECGHNSILKALLAAGASVECPFPNLSGPLHIAAARGNAEGCRQLIRAGCNIEAKSERQRTALYVAADANRPAVVDVLVAHGANPDGTGFEPPLQIAADIGSMSMLRLLLEGRNIPDVDAKGETGETALGIAASYGDLDMVSCLLDHGADPNLRSGQRTSNTPLQLAAHARKQAVMIELLKRGADPFPERPKESSPFHTACTEGYMDVVETFFEMVDDAEELINFEWGWYGTPLLQAALGGRLEIVELLLAKGANPDYKLKSKINNGKTMIHAAAEGGDIKVLEAIVAVADDPDLEVRDFKQRTPLYYACIEGREDMVDYLLEKGVQSDVILTTGENLTAGIIDGGSAKILDRVLEKHPNMDIDISRTDGKTPLFFAVTHGYAKIIKTLLDRGADANRRSKNGDFPLSEAIRYREKESLKVLLEHKSTDLTQLDVFGRGVLQIAQQAGSHPMPSMILAAAKTPELETFLSENRDMFGNNANDLTRIDIKRKPSWEHCIETIRKDAQALLDDFELRGPRWERLGKFCLQISAYSFAQVALQRSVEAVETTPLFLEHQVHCRLCLDLIAGVRYTCRTCCNTDLCLNCMRRVPKMGYRMWTCQFHIFYQVMLPGPWNEPPKQVWGMKGGEESADARLDMLSDIAEESESEEEDHGHVENPANTLEPIDEGATSEGGVAEESPVEEVKVSAVASEMMEPEASASPTKISERDAFVDPLPDALRRTSTNLSLEEGELEDDGNTITDVVALPSTDEYVELAEGQLREFLEAVLKTFTPEQTPDSLAKWDFSADTWKLRHNLRARARLGDPEGDAMPDLLRPSRGLKPMGPQSDAYEFLAPLAFLFAHVPLHLVLTEIPFKAYERRALRKRRQLQKLIGKAIRPTRRIGELDRGIDD
ncbi:ankyrin repeat-containing domain protein [Dactylonectria macrodidyma]|uniref:Ankyrin repeat-containing domain protein n=1 Tax=Dactylonectria macrodidyma TaxID=307937 RepID=A0A9P9FT16_9HYPO|nr:ankyrin repeat-containing domain protein [Dactylonectria macrodidyma]